MIYFVSRSSFTLKDLGEVHYFFGIEVSTPKDDNLHLSETRYVQNLLHQKHITDSNPQPTPMVLSLKISTRCLPCVLRSFFIYIQHTHKLKYERSSKGEGVTFLMDFEGCSRFS